MELALGLTLRALLVLLLPAVLSVWRKEVARGRYW
jgi:hypothetical protein